MNEMPKFAMSRRTFLEGMVAVTALWVTPSMGQISAFDPWTEVFGRLSNHGALRKIGHQYLRSQPRPLGVDKLKQELSSGALGTLRQGADSASIRHAITRAIRDDFSTDRIAVVDGWWLSQTEAQLCGLVALAT